MAGNANSGDRSRSDKEKRRNAIQKAWLRSIDSLDGRDLKPQQFEMAKAIVVKSMPEQTEQIGEVKVTVSHVELAKRLECYSKK